jgi:hypothetical protein
MSKDDKVKLENLSTHTLFQVVTANAEGLPDVSQDYRRTDVSYMFENITTNGKFYYNSNYDYSKIIAQLPTTWTAIAM